MRAAHRRARSPRQRGSKFGAAPRAVAQRRRAAEAASAPCGCALKLAPEANAKQSCAPDRCVLRARALLKRAFAPEAQPRSLRRRAAPRAAQAPRTSHGCRLRQLSQQQQRAGWLFRPRRRLRLATQLFRLRSGRQTARRAEGAAALVASHKIRAASVHAAAAGSACMTRNRGCSMHLNTGGIVKNSDDECARRRFTPRPRSWALSIYCCCHKKNHSMELAQLASARVSSHCR